MNQWLFVNFGGVKQIVFGQVVWCEYEVSDCCAQCAGKYLADKMLILWHFSGITAPVVSGYHACGEWLQEFRQLTACFISARTKSVSQHTVSFGLIRVPVPLLTSFVFDKTPLFIKFTDKCHIDTGGWRYGYFTWWAFLKWEWRCWYPPSAFWSYREPRPLWTISTICSLMHGFRVS